MKKIKIFRDEIIQNYEPIAIDKLTKIPQEPKFSILNFMLIPIITIGIYILLFAFFLQGTGNFYLFFIVSAGIGMVTSIIRFGFEKWAWKKNCEKITADNLNYITNLANKSKQHGDNYKKEYEQCFPSLRGSVDYNWVRTPRQKSFLMTRVGLHVAKNPSALYYVNSDISEEIQDKYKSIVEENLLIDGVPYVLDLKKHKIIGVFGTNKDCIFNSLIMNTVLFHLEDDLRVCTLNAKKEFSWCAKIPHANHDAGINLYAEKTKDIPEIVKKFKGLAKLKDNRWNILILVSDSLLQIRQIRDVANEDNTQIFVLCDGEPTAYCDVVIGNGIVSYSEKTSKDVVQLDALPLNVSDKYMQNFSIAKRSSESSNEKDDKLSTYIDARNFFGPPNNKE